jgi:hypothetical protein
LAGSRWKSSSGSISERYRPNQVPSFTLNFAG